MGQGHRLSGDTGASGGEAGEGEPSAAGRPLESGVTAPPPSSALLSAHGTLMLLRGETADAYFRVAPPAGPPPSPSPVFSVRSGFFNFYVSKGSGCSMR